MTVRTAMDSKTHFPEGTMRQSTKCTNKRIYKAAVSSETTSGQVATCQPPPVVFNASATFDQAKRHVIVTCNTGHRFPNERTTNIFKCNEDGSWNYVDAVHCRLMLCPQ